MKIFLIAGEASGDLHGSHLAKELKMQHPGVALQGWGGDKMAEQGVTLLKHYRELAFMGFVEVLMNISTIRKNFALIKEQIAAFAPDKIVFIDYPGFNLRLTHWAKSQGIETHYYISPTIWAWKEGRVENIKKYVDHMYCILPFEPAVYTKHHYQAEFVGHPLLDDWAAQPANQAPTKDFIVLAPGSRKQELKRILPAFLTVVARFPNEKFIIAGAPGLEAVHYAPYLKGYENQVQLVFGQTPELMRNAKAGMIASGTATLEAALRGLPILVGYSAQPLSIWIAKRLVKLTWISLVNLILNEERVKEFIQEKMTVTALEKELRLLLSEGGQRQAENTRLELIEKLGGPGASARVAQLILKK